MSIFKVYHAKKGNFFAEDIPFSDYELIAEVEANSLDNVFGETNHIDSDWAENKSIVKIHKDKRRSTSVGDIIQDETGTFYRCEPIGWSTLDENLKRI
jgi:hypothetical protein